MKKLLLGGVVVFSLGACTHAPVSVEPVAPTYSFKTVDAYPPERAVNAATKGAKAKKTEKKYVAVVPQGQEGPGEQRKLVPYEKFADSVKEKVKTSGDVVAKQEFILQKTLDALKEHKTHLEQDKRYYTRQIQTYRYASLRPVIEGFERGLRGVEMDLKDCDGKIQQFNEDINTIRNLKPMRMGSVEADKVMQLVDNGKWNVGEQLAPDERVLWNFFQSVAREN